MEDVARRLEKERDALIAEIRGAFAGVVREGGVSWSEADVIDDLGTEEECRAARMRDRDTSWVQLVDDESWEPGLGFEFLDAIGFRYYLPAAMIRDLRDDEAALQHALELTVDNKGRPSKHTVAQWSLLDARQRRAVAAFVRHMMRRDEQLGGTPEESPWGRAWRSCWVNEIEGE